MIPGDFNPETMKRLREAFPELSSLNDEELFDAVKDTLKGAGILFSSSMENLMSTIADDLAQGIKGAFTEGGVVPPPTNKLTTTLFGGPADGKEIEVEKDTELIIVSMADHPHGSIFQVGDIEIPVGKIRLEHYTKRDDGIFRHASPPTVPPKGIY